MPGFHIESLIGLVKEKERPERMINKVERLTGSIIWHMWYNRWDSYSLIKSFNFSISFRFMLLWLTCFEFLFDFLLWHSSLVGFFIKWLYFALLVRLNLKLPLVALIHCVPVVEHREDKETSECSHHHGIESVRMLCIIGDEVIIGLKGRVFTEFNPILVVWRDAILPSLIVCVE